MNAFLVGFRRPAAIPHVQYVNPASRGSMSRIVLATAVLTASFLNGCADQMLSNDRIRDSIAGSLGLPTSDITIVDRRGDGPVNTNVIVEARNNGRYVCTINGGGILSMGMTNAAYCHRPGAT